MTTVGTAPALTATVGPQTFTRVIPVNPRLTLDAAKSITTNNGYDEVFLQTASGKLYAAIGNGGQLNLRTGFVGRVNGEWAQVVHVEDETNSIREGAKSPFRVMGNLLTNSGSTAVTAMITTTIGGVMAASAVGGATATRGIGALARTAGGAFTTAMQRLAVSGAIGVGISAMALGAWSGIGAIRGATRKGDNLTLQMLQ